MTANPPEQAAVNRVAQTREDGRQQDRQEERADHCDERRRDRRDQQKEKDLAETGLCHGEPGIVASQGKWCSRGAPSDSYNRFTISISARTTSATGAPTAMMTSGNS